MVNLGDPEERARMSMEMKGENYQQNNISKCPITKKYIFLD